MKYNFLSKHAHKQKVKNKQCMLVDITCSKYCYMLTATLEIGYMSLNTCS